MNTIKTVGDLRKALSAYPEDLPFKFNVNGKSIGSGLSTDLAIYQVNSEFVGIDLTDLVTGLTNPALVALACVRTLEVEFDAESFLEVAKHLDNDLVDPGMVITGFHELHHICDKGNFNLTVKNGVYYAEAR